MPSLKLENSFVIITTRTRDRLTPTRSRLVPSQNNYSKAEKTATMTEDKLDINEAALEIAVSLVATPIIKAPQEL